MTRRNLQVLAAIVVGLVLMLFVLESTDRSDSFSDGRALLPELEARANDVTLVSILPSGASEGVTIRRAADTWVVSARDDYAADMGKLRPLIIALTEAAIIEEKTANPEQYGKLGVDDPEDGGSGDKIRISGDGFSYTVILGKPAQRDFRYARIPDQPASVLIDRNPDIPETAGDWLLPDIIDVDSSRVRSVAIRHADGENIVIEKSAADMTDFSVLDVPAGRELSYATVGNGIAGALSQLKLQDVRARRDAAAETTVVYDTWDGLQVTAEVSSDTDTSWVAFSIEASPVAPMEDAPDSTQAPDAAGAAVTSEADELNRRLSPWQFQLPDFKKNLLLRRWDDILKASGED